MIKRSSPLHFANAAFRRLAFYYAAQTRFGAFWNMEILDKNNI